MTAHQASEKAHQILEQDGLSGFVDWDRSQFLDLPGRTYVELLIRDAARQDEVNEAVSGIQDEAEIEVHPSWAIASIGEADVARTSSGAIAPATLVPVLLLSGSSSTLVRVLFTFLAEQELGKLMGKNPDLGSLARVYVESLLRWGGRSYWDPRKRDWLEIGSERALTLHRALKKSA